MKYVVLHALSFLFILNTQAQKVSIELFGGASNYQGDLQDKRFTFNQAHVAGGLGVHYSLSDHFSVRTGVLLGKVSGDDKLGRNKIRNLNFTSGITDVHLALQYYITPLGKNPLTPYVFAGVGLYHFNPYTFDTTNSKYFLRPLSTEGQGFLAGKNYYQLTQFNIPFGAGVKLALSENLNVGLEVSMRKLFTDHLDDVSTEYVDQNLLIANRGPKAVELAFRGGELKNGGFYPPAGTARGGAKNKDWYYFTGLTLSFKLGNGTVGHSGKHSQYGCPVNVY
ncbi:MAG: DUF6089 family protein [Ginsengibacter sp.]